MREEVHSQTARSEKLRCSGMCLQVEEPQPKDEERQPYQSQADYGACSEARHDRSYRLCRKTDGKVAGTGGKGKGIGRFRGQGTLRYISTEGL